MRFISICKAPGMPGTWWALYEVHPTFLLQRLSCSFCLPFHISTTNLSLTSWQHYFLTMSIPAWTLPPFWYVLHMVSIPLPPALLKLCHSSTETRWMLPMEYGWRTSDSWAWDHPLATGSRAKQFVCDYRVKTPLTGPKPLPKRILLIIHCKLCILEGLNLASLSRNVLYCTPNTFCTMGSSA